MNMGEGAAFSVKDISSKAAGFFRRLAEIIVPAADTILEKIPEDKRKPVLFCAGAVVFFLISIVVVLLARPPREARPAFPEAALAVPGGELFLPGEPDFVPGLLPAREVKRPWTADELAPFWKDPLPGREDIFREEMSAVIDDLMEAVP